MATMDCLPPEIIQIILLKLPLIDVFRFMRINRTWNQAANAILREKRGMQLLDTSPDDDSDVRCIHCDHPDHKKKDPSRILQVDGTKLEWEDMEYILKKMGNGLQVLNVSYHDEDAMIFVGDLTPNLECLQVRELHPPDKALPRLKHLYVRFCNKDILHRLDEWFPSLEVLDVDHLNPYCFQSRQAKFRHGMTSIRLPDIDLYELSQWPALETLKTLCLMYPTCSRMFSFRAPHLEDFHLSGMANDLNQEYHENLIQSILGSHSLKYLGLKLRNINVDLMKQLLSGLPQLITVSLTCLIDDEAVSIIQTTANNVEELSLYRASITDTTLDHLKNLPKLKKAFILVRSQGFTLEGLRSFCQEVCQPNGEMPFYFGIGQKTLNKHSAELNDWIEIIQHPLGGK